MKTLRRMAGAAVVSICLIGGTGWAQDADPRAEDRKQLLNVLTEVEAAINDQNIDRMLAQMDEKVTVIWLNAEVSRGKQEVKAYYRRMVGGEQAILKKYLTKAKLGASAKFHGDVAIADGSAADEFYPVARGYFTLDSRWSSTMVKNAGEWKIVSLHLSSNVFNNPLLDEVKADILKAGAGGILGGLLLMYLFMRLRRRR
jgi:ketosteroid isomerase-like protein